jgi:hypothetical protein
MTLAASAFMRAANRSRLVPALALALATAALACAACESRRYLYEPAVASSATVAGRAASHYRIPPEASHGEVRVASFGLADIEPADERMRFADEPRAIHVRLVVANNSDAAWWVDTRDVHAVLPANGKSRAAFARVDEGALPVVVVPPGDKRTIDLFFPLPEDMQEASELSSFDTIWSVQMPTMTIAERTPFERLDVPPATYPYDCRWGPPYYYDPLYGRGAFIGVRLGHVWMERPVVIERHVTLPPSPAAPPGRRVR